MQERLRAVAVGLVGVVLAGGVLGVGEGVGSGTKVPQPVKAVGGFEGEVRPLLKKYCYECHGEGAEAGELAIDSFKTIEDVRKGKKEWEKVLRYVRSHVMPPPEADAALGVEDREKMVRGVRKYLYDLKDGAVEPGRVVVRRLNKVEYRNTVRDLTGVEIDPTIDFPEDDTGYGFDNIGDVLTLPPMLMEKYFSAAERVVEAALPGGVIEKKSKRVVAEGEGKVLSSADEGEIAVPVEAGVTGEYVVKVLAYARVNRDEGGRMRDEGEAGGAKPQAATRASTRATTRAVASTRPAKDTLTVSLMVGDVVGEEVEVRPGEARWYEGRVSVIGGKRIVKAAVRRERGPVADRVISKGRIGEEQGGVVVVKEVVVEGPVKGAVRRVGAGDLRLPNGNEGASRAAEQVVLFSNAGETSASFEVGQAGAHVIRVAAAGSFLNDGQPVKMEVSLDRSVVKTVDVRSPGAYQGKEAVGEAGRRAVYQVYEVPVRLEAGRRRVSVRMLNDAYREEAEANWRDRNLFVNFIELVDPAGEAIGPRVAPGVRELLTKHGGASVANGGAEPKGETAREMARRVLGDFARRAWRRPVTAEEMGRVMRLYAVAEENKEGFRGSLRHAMKGVLVSSSFLFRGAGATGDGGRAAVQQVSEYELAERLSYFLWSTTPDEELMALAGKGELRKNLSAQVKRMLASPKASALAEQFGGQWLQFRNLDAAHPDRKMFRGYDDKVRDAMKRETQMLFENLVKEDRAVTELLTADYTFVNEPLAKHYGMEGVKGLEFRRVSLEGTRRRGVLTHGSVLTLTSNPTRTSPVKRGKWVLENLLGAEPPAAPESVPALEAGPGAAVTGTLRQRLEKHREDPGCASCHAAMDPIGLGLENFDAIGQWREKDAGEPVDSKSEFTGGKAFSGARELVDILVADRGGDMMRAAAEKMLTFAIGRGMEAEDGPVVDAIVERAKGNGGRFSSLIMGVVESVPFQMRRGVAPSTGNDQAQRTKDQTIPNDQIQMTKAGP